MSAQQASMSKLFALLHEWDKRNVATRKKILQDFIAQNQGKTGPELEEEFALGASLFLTRLTCWLRLTYMVGTCLTEQLKAIHIFVSASSGQEFMKEFIEVGGVATLLELIGIKQAVKEIDKREALRILHCISDHGRKYKELICDNQGTRSIAECMVKAKSEATQNDCRNMLVMLAEGNPKFAVQVYNGLIALLSCKMYLVQEMAAKSLRTVQPIVKKANIAIVQPLLNVLKTLDLDAQFEAIQLVKELMAYEIGPSLLDDLVALLQPEDIKKPDLLDDENVPMINAPLPVYVQQAATAKTIGILARGSKDLAERMIQLRVVRNLVLTMGNIHYADSQRQASISLQYLCKNFPIVNDNVKGAVGDNLYGLFMSNPESVYLNMTPVQADILVSNKLNIPKSMVTANKDKETDIKD